MIRLSVNVNKVATLRNSRGGSIPAVTDAVRACLDAGAPGITVHPRADRRHITPEDVRAVAALLANRAPHVEYNLEGDPRPDFLALVLESQPDQCTLVPVMPGEVTSQAGWLPGTPGEELSTAIGMLADASVRVSLFVDPTAEAIRWAANLGAHRVELYTEPYARAWERGDPDRRRSLECYADAARLAHALGMGVNAGHDLSLDNLPLFARTPHLAEVSIGHALISHALFVGLDRAVRDYLTVVSAPADGVGT